MIRPGLLTASTNKADHLGTSGAGLVACRCIDALLSLRVVLVRGLKQCFPLVGTLGHEWVPERTPVGAKRSGALGGFAESCADGLSWHNRPEEGETKIDCSAGMERSGMQAEALLIRVRVSARNQAVTLERFWF